MNTEKGCGNDGLWKPRKTNGRFPSATHRPWKSLRDSHIPTGPTTTESVSLRSPTRVASGSENTQCNHFRYNLKASVAGQFPLIVISQEW